MSVLQQFHGTLALVLICCLLFVDEAGIPLPIAPNEGLLLLIGILLADDAFPVWLILPAAFLAMAAGMMVGYGWARTVGQSGLLSIVEKVHAEKVYERAQNHLRSANPWHIALSRTIPGLRPYATLISGAAEVEVRTFLMGAVPALVVWEIVWVLVGMLIGWPVAHFLGRFEKLALRGLILIAFAVVAWFAVRDASERRGGITGIAPRLRAVLALAVDTAIVVSVVGGSFNVGRRFIPVSVSVWLELGISAVLLIVLLVLGRSIQTPGETLFDTHYWHRVAATT